MFCRHAGILATERGLYHRRGPRAWSRLVEVAGPAALAPDAPPAITYNGGMTQPHEPEASPLFCDRCQLLLEPGRGNFYVVRIEAVCDPDPPALDDDDLDVDYQAEYARLVEELRSTSAQEAMDQVFRRLTIYSSHGLLPGVD